MVTCWALCDRKAADAWEEVLLSRMSVYISTDPNAEADFSISNLLYKTNYP